MSEQSDKSAKIYYTIGEVARMFDVNTSLIRYWEKEFDIIQPKKNKKGNRLFTQQDVENFNLIYNLVKERRYTINGAREKLKQNPRSSLSDFDIIRSLNKIEAFLLNIRQEIDRG